MDSFELEALELLKQLWIDLRERRKQIEDLYGRSGLVDLLSVDAALEHVQKEVGNSLKLRKKSDLSFDDWNVLQLTGIDKVYAFIGGLHLTGGLFEAIIPRTVAELTAIGPTIVVPGHCSGWKATHEVARHLSEAYIQTSVGTRLHLTWTLMGDPGGRPYISAV